MDLDLVVQVFREGRKCEQNGNFKKAKECYLDAATYAVELAKESISMEDTERLKNIAKMLIDHARKMKSKISGEPIKTPVLSSMPQDVNEVDLPLPPNQSNVQTATIQEPKEIVSKENENISPHIPKLNYILILSASGSPILTFDYTVDYSKTPELAFSKMNEVLLSGAITAIFSIMEEALNNKVRKIELENEFLYVKDYNGLIFTALGDGDADAIDQPIINLLKNLVFHYSDNIEKAKKTGQMIEINEHIVSMMIDFREQVINKIKKMQVN